MDKFDYSVVGEAGTAAMTDGAAFLPNPVMRAHYHVYETIRSADANGGIVLDRPARLSTEEI